MKIERMEGPSLTDVARALVRDYFRSWGTDEADDPHLLEELGSLAERYSKPDGCALVGWIGDEPAGVVCLRRVDERTCVMKRMFVRPQFRRRGIARRLALELIDEAGGLGYERMVLDTPDDNAPALALYLSIGFRDTAPFSDPSHGHVHEDWAFLEISIPQRDAES